jgi:TonB family protein
MLALAVWLAAAAGVAGQETFARAKELYVNASYDEALVLLTRLHESAEPPESTEIAGYQVFCLVALGRTDDARQAIAALAKADPLYLPPEATTSPRTRALFAEVRKGLLPGIVQDTYDHAKAAYDRKEPQVALAGFDKVLALLDEPGLAGQPNMVDLRRLATGFRDLIKTTPAAPDPPAAAPTNASAPAASAVAPVPDLPSTYSSSDVGVVPPVTVSRPMPPWRPRSEVERVRQFLGALEVIVDEQGDVISVVIAKTVHPTYDADLLRMARTWKFRPATKDGVPVRYRRTLEIRLGPGGGT